MEGRAPLWWSRSPWFGTVPANGRLTPELKKTPSGGNMAEAMIAGYDDGYAAQITSDVL